MKRSDRSEKLRLRKTHQETVVKSSLKKYLLGNKESIVDALKKRVLAYSKRVNVASLALMGILKELFHNQENVLDVQLPDYTDQTFFRQLLVGTDDAQKPNDLITNYQKRFPSLFQNVERFSADRNIFSAGAIKYITNLKNSLWMNFPGRVKQFTKSFQAVEKISDEERISLLYLIMGWNVSVSSLGCIFPARESVQETSNQHRKVLGLEDDQVITTQWIENKENLDSFLRYYVVLNRYYEENELATFNLVPICKIKRHFITVDSSSLYGIMKGLKLIDCNNTVFQSLKEHHWNSFLNIQRLQNGEKQFTGTIETDGVSLCTHFKAPKKVSDTEKKAYKYNSQQDRVIGIDTGRVNIMSCAEVLEDGSIKRYNLSRKQYYCDTGAFKARTRAQTWNKNVQKELKLLSRVSTKGVSLQNHQKFLDTYSTTSPALWDEYTKERWSRSRLSLYGGKQRTWDRFFNQIKEFDPEKQVVIAYGASKFDPSGKGEMAVPTSQVYKETIRRFKTYLVDEFRTSKIFYKDDSVLELVAKRKKPRSSVRGLLWSGSSNNEFFIDRDLNAALNIRRCLVNPVRPISLTRIPGQQRLSQTITKIIK